MTMLTSLATAVKVYQTSRLALMKQEGFGTGLAWGEEVSRLLFVWLVFIGATTDFFVRAFETATGRELWFFLLTGPHTTNIPGLFRTGVASLAEEMPAGPPAAATP